MNAFAHAWTFPDGVTYLNHGSFGPSPHEVRSARQAWSDRLESQPMDFFLRRMEPALEDAALAVGEFVGAARCDLTFCPNATVAMNIVAETMAFAPGDEILLTDQEYGAVLRIWQRACARTGGTIVQQPLPRPITSVSQQVDALMSAVTPRTRLIVVSHITSPTAVIFPVQEICDAAAARGIPVCIDGPHALAMVDVNLRQLGCAFYAASCHKWLCGPFGSGFLYVHPDYQGTLRTPVTSWGMSLSQRPPAWQDEFRWWGTHDPAAYLAVPSAIRFMHSCGVQAFRESTHALVQEARQRIVEITGLEPPIPDDPRWYGSMISLPLPPLHQPVEHLRDRDPLQERLWQRYGIEIPVVHWNGQRMIRISCHLYNTPEHLDRLCAALREEL